MYKSKFSDIEFDSMTYPIHGSTLPVWNTFPLFKVFVTDNEKLNKLHDKYIKYVLYLYDPKTPLSNIPDLIERKNESLELADLFTDNIDERIVQNKVEKINEIASFLFRQINNRKWALRCAKEQAYYTLIENLLKPVLDTEPEKRKAALAVLRQCSDDADVIEKSITLLDSEMNKNQDDSLEITIEHHKKNSLLNLLEQKVRDKDKILGK